MNPAPPRMDLVVGIDCGTSGIRAVAMDADGAAIVARAAVDMPPPLRNGLQVTQSPQVWADAFDACLDALHAQVEPRRVAAVAVDGTSGTVLVTDAGGRPLADARLYHDAAATPEGERVSSHAPADSAAQGAASGLARALRLLREAPDAARVLHQADWLGGRLLGRFGDSDDHNALKTGFDPRTRTWPAWLAMVEPSLPAKLPRVHEPGSPIGSVSRATAARHGWRDRTTVAAGTTDGVAAFLATGASEEGDAVTSLGSTLVVKQLGRTPIAAPRYGVYSHRLGDLWLPGGASNAGGTALLQQFSVARLRQLEPLLEPDRPTGLDYYPLPSVGERFPVHDPTLAPRVAPRPDDDARFLQGLLEGLAAIEAMAYARLRELGGPPLRSVRTVGGGSVNAAWTRIRQRALGVPMLPALHTDAAAGAARLAAQALHRAR